MSDSPSITHKITVSSNLFKLSEVSNPVKTDKAIIAQIENIPYDGMAAKRKHFGVSELIVATSPSRKNKKNFDNFVEKVPFPLIETISNRKMLNHKASFLRKLLISNKLPLGQEQKNTIKYKLYKSKKKSKLNNNFHFSSDLNTYKNLVMNKLTKSVSVSQSTSQVNTERSQIKSAIEAYNNNLNSNFILNPNSYRTDYQEKRLKYHISNIMNKEFLFKHSLKGDNNYARNAYKVQEPDIMMTKIKNDVAMLKYGDRLRRIENIL